MKGLCSYCSRYFFCSKRPNQNEEDVILCSSFTQNNDNEENGDPLSISEVSVYNDCVMIYD